MNLKRMEAIFLRLPSSPLCVLRLLRLVDRTRLLFSDEVHVVDNIYLATARHYFVDDLPGALQPAARLQSILDRLRLGKPTTSLALSFLQEQHLLALRKLITGEITYEIFQAEAIVERGARIDRVVAAKVAKEEVAAAREAEMQKVHESDRAKARAERAARETDPRYISKMKNRELRARYGIRDYVDEENFVALMGILKKADAGTRLSEEDVAWLSSVGEGYFTDELQTAYHRAEALALSAEFKATGNPWAAVTASGHYRKCKQSGDAELLLKPIRIEGLNGNKLKSALCTTRGGVMRDLGNLIEAKTLAEKAHAFMPKDFRPCTLLGAIHMELGDLRAGGEWYEKAIERGATHDSVDRDLRSIYFRADAAMKAKLSDFLLSQDRVRYAWVLAKGNGRNPHKTD